MNISQSFQNMLDSVVAFLPRALAFLAILVIGWIVSKVVGKLVGKLLHKVGLDKVGEKSGLRRYTGKFELSDLLGKLVYFALLLFTLQLAFGAFGNNPVSDLLNQLVAWLPQLFVALVIVVVAFAIANAVHSIISGTLSGTNYGNIVARISQVAIIFFGAVAALGQVGIATTVTTPILWTVLAMIAGTVIVGVGGGLIGPMRQRWEKMLATAEGEASKMKESNGSQGDPTSSMSQTYRSGRYGTETNAQAPSGTVGEEAGTRSGTTYGATGGTGAGTTGGPSAGGRIETERPMPPNEP
ncbi:hypothetical protein K3N28_13350 [Glycomyces sp. TRM65418]|uniref:mechanosensitive ion channel family protein n=1 Tax=Glycomyces sp. TRM65418 TaxID=2867006 RepID=UPI001CE5D8A1|nr:hypothetical protein [Glycomyces sp. TRM65418]MCC3764051.1 hypothetical protein [Glycomyces sp. TRM65418]QZD53742.1 hypothetical protein K3N28_13285 [Glycomyces sp. TRM65418]